MHYLMHSFNKRYGVCLYYIIQDQQILGTSRAGAGTQDRFRDCHHAIIRQTVNVGEYGSAMRAQSRT
jgi:hypothetical protein